MAVKGRWGWGIILLLLLAGCATTTNYQQILNRWQGANVQDLINSWGYPDGSVKLPNGNKVYMYTRQQLYTTPPPLMPTPLFVNVQGTPVYTTAFTGGVVGGQTEELYCRTWFEVNPKGIIVNSQSQGNACVSSNRNGLVP